MRMTRRAQGIVVVLAVSAGVALASGAVVALAGSGKLGTTTTTGSAIVGTHGPDRLIGTDYHDSIDGRGGADLIRGRGGRDSLRGGRGRDEIVGGKGFDRINAGGGPDTVRVRDHRPDTMACGRGRDVAIVDRIEDGVYDCEVLRIPKPAQAKPGR